MSGGDGSSDDDMENWLGAIGVFRSASQQTGENAQHNFDHAAGLVPDADTIVLLSIDSHMLGNRAHPSPKATHSCRLHSRIVEQPAGTVDFKFWCWAEPV
jgi:hypothetical protein